MSYDFKYVPTSGAIAGETFISQTEIAFNELGQEVEGAIKSSEEANISAGKASQTANEALTTANDAFSTAKSAEKKADEANEKSDEAKIGAEAATSKADEAYDLAASAKSESGAAGGNSFNAEKLAGEAKEIAINAKDTSVEAKGEAEAALDRAEQASEKSDEALIMAEAASDFYDENIDPADANTLIHELEKTYFTSESELSNFPLKAPLWFKVRATKDFSQVTQDCWNGACAKRRVIEAIPTPFAADNMMEFTVKPDDSAGSQSYGYMLLATPDLAGANMGYMFDGEAGSTLEITNLAPLGIAGKLRLAGFSKWENGVLKLSSFIHPYPSAGPLPEIELPTDALLVSVEDSVISIVQESIDTGAGLLTINKVAIEGGQLVLEISFTWTLFGKEVSVDLGEWYALSGSGGGDGGGHQSLDSPEIDLLTSPQKVFLADTLDLGLPVSLGNAVFLDVMTVSGQGASHGQAEYCLQYAQSQNSAKIYRRHLAAVKGETPLGKEIIPIAVINTVNGKEVETKGSLTINLQAEPPLPWSPPDRMPHFIKDFSIDFQGGYVSGWIGENKAFYFDGTMYYLPTEDVLSAFSVEATIDDETGKILNRDITTGLRVMDKKLPIQDPGPHQVKTKWGGIDVMFSWEEIMGYVRFTIKLETYFRFLATKNAWSEWEIVG